MEKVTLVELETILQRIKDGVPIEEYKEQMLQVAKGFKELTVGKQKDDQRNATALERLKKEKETEVSKKSDEFQLKINKLAKEHAEEIASLKTSLEGEVAKAKEQALKEYSAAGTPSVEVFKVLDEAESLVKTLVSKTPWLSGVASDFLNKVKTLKK